MFLALVLIGVASAVAVHEGHRSAPCSTVATAVDPASIDPDQLCSLNIVGSRPGVLPDLAQVKAALGTPALIWTLGAPDQPQTLSTDSFAVFAACLGSGSLRITVTSKSDQPWPITFGCNGRIGPGIDLPAEVVGVTDTADQTQTFTLSTEVIGQVTAAEYFVMS